MGELDPAGEKSDIKPWSITDNDTLSAVDLNACQ